MPYGVPQFIDVEDKVAGPLTAKQLLWFFGGGGILLLLWNVLDKPAFFVAAVPVVLITVAFAFVRPNGRPLLYFMFDGIAFFFKPKIYTWRRMPQIAKRAKKKRYAYHKEEAHKELTAEEIANLTKTLDSRGKNVSRELHQGGILEINDMNTR